MPSDSKTHRLFFYGSLRKGEYNHTNDLDKHHVADGIIRGAALVGGNGYPWIITSEDASDLVVGEVYDIPALMFKYIEAMEKGAGYERRKVVVHHVVNGPEHDPRTFDNEMEAEAYFYIDEEALKDYPRIASGDWTQRDKLTKN